PPGGPPPLRDARPGVDAGVAPGLRADEPPGRGTIRVVERELQVLAAGREPEELGDRQDTTHFLPAFRPRQEQRRVRDVVTGTVEPGRVPRPEQRDEFVHEPAAAVELDREVEPPGLHLREEAGDAVEPRLDFRQPGPAGELAEPV